MKDYERFLGEARRRVAHVARVAARLLRERRISQATHDALTCAAGQILHDAYQAGRCEPEAVAR